jgi:TRAP-type transport system small permease protein
MTCSLPSRMQNGACPTPGSEAVSIAQSGTALVPTVARLFGVVDRAIIWASAIAVIVLMAAMVFAVVLGVYYRYVLNAALAWPEEFSRYSMIWVGTIGSALLVRYGGHIAVELLERNLSGVAAVVVRYLAKACMLLFLVLVLYYGLDMAGRVARQTSAALGVSMSLPYSALPVGAALMIYHLVVGTVRGEDSGRRRPPYLPTE